MRGLNKKHIRRLYNVFVLLVLLCAVAYVCNKFVHIGRVEYTNNAQVYRLITPVNTRVQGFVREIRFTDFQQVHRGDTLLIIDDAEYRLRLLQAQADVSGTLAGTEVVAAGMHTTAAQEEAAAAGSDEARVERDNARADLTRYEHLLAKHAVTQQQYDNVRTRYAAAEARYSQASSQRQSTARRQDELSAERSRSDAAVQMAVAAVDLARLNLSYTVLVAPCDGKMGRKTIQEGQLVAVGQTVAEIVADSDVWVVANYRERQMAHIKVGDAVRITADAVPATEYRGVVEVVAGATGAAFSRTPTDNATGNFVKVEQRVPVRIRLSDDNSKEDVARLLGGMNVETEVRY